MKKESLSSVLLKISEAPSKEMTLGNFLHALGSRGHAFVILVLSLPFMLPIPLPGLSVALGLILAASGLGLGFGFDLTLPVFLRKRTLPSGFFLFLKKGAELLKKVEHFLKPRFEFILASPLARMTFGLMVAANGLILFLPLPPGTNFPPALVSLLMALGFLERDGFMVLLATFIFLLEISVAITLLVFGMEFLAHISHKVS